MKLLFGNRIFEAKALFFDKDGTLVDFHHQFSTLMEKRSEIILSEWTGSGESLRHEIGTAVGFDPDTRKISPSGVLGVGTRAETMYAVSGVLIRKGLDKEEAHQRVARAFSRADHELRLEELVKPADGTLAILPILKQRGFLLACLTNDEKKRTRAVLDCVRIGSYFDLILCADEVSRPKPDPEIFEKACRRLGLQAGDVAFIGDTVADLTMARKARAGLAVGVLGGASARSLLTPDADVVLESLNEISFPLDPSGLKNVGAPFPAFSAG